MRGLPHQRSVTETSFLRGHRPVHNKPIIWARCPVCLNRKDGPGNGPPFMRVVANDIWPLVHAWKLHVNKEMWDDYQSTRARAATDHRGSLL